MATFFNCSSLHGNHSSIIISFTFSFFSPSGLHSGSLYLAAWCSVQSSWYLSVFFSKQPLLHTLNKLDRFYLPGSLRRETNLPNAIWRHHTSPCTVFLFLKISGGSFEVYINSSHWQFNFTNFEPHFLSHFFSENTLFKSPLRDYQIFEFGMDVGYQEIRIKKQQPILHRLS